MKGKNFLEEFSDVLDKAVSQGFPRDEAEKMRNRMIDFVRDELIPRMDAGIKQLKEFLRYEPPREEQAPSCPEAGT